MLHFYSFPQDRKLLVSDLPLEKIKSKFGYKFEKITSVAEKESVAFILGRLLKNFPGYIVEEQYKKERRYLSAEAKEKISASKLGKPRSPEVRARISAALKGRSNFQGKSHTKVTKDRMAAAKLGNSHARGTIWAHNPRSDEEVRVRDLKEIPKGFSQGRDYYSTEPGLYYFKR